MKHNLRKRLLTVLLAMVMLAAVLASCSSETGSSSAGADTSPSSSSGSGSAAGGEEGETPISFPLEESYTLTIAAPDGVNVSLANNLPLWQEIERRTNVKINWDVIAPTQYVEVMKLRLTAGNSQLPDVMLIPNGLSMTDLAKQDFIINLEELMAVHGPELLEMYQSNPDLMSATSLNGQIYSVNTMVEGAFGPYGFIIRMDWLDRLDLDEPETIEDWVEVLTAFRDMDANGDGNTNDEIPFSAGGHAWYTTFWAHAWGLHLFQSDGWYPDANGVMQYEFISDEAKEFYTWLNNFYEEGLLDPEFMTMGSEDKMFEKVVRNEVGAFTAHPKQIEMLEAALVANGVEDAYLKPLAPPKGPYDQMTEVVGGIAFNGYVVTTSCERPDITVALMNYLYATDEGKELMNFGIEGITYNKNADGTYTFTDMVINDPNGRTANEVLLDFGCKSGFPYIGTLASDEAMMFNMPERLRKDILEVTEKSAPHIVNGIILPPATDEENEYISGVGGDLASYIWEMTGKFTVGTESLDNWDSFVENVKGMGLDKLLEVRQARYDRLDG